MDVLPDTRSTALSVAIVQLAAVYFIIRSGTLLTTRPYAQIVSMLIALLLVGMLFKILHWEGANLLLMISLLSFPLLYTVRFILKSTHNLLDIAKFLWVLAAFASILFNISHWKYGDELAGIQHALFWAMALAFFYTLALKNKKQAAGSHH